MSSVTLVSRLFNQLITTFTDGSSTDATLADLSRVTFGTSSSAALVSESVAVDYSLYPMPVQNDLYLNFESRTAAIATLQVLTLDGRTILSSAPSVICGNNTLTLNVNTLEPGMYICRLTYGTEQYTQQIIKQ